jgi:uncharacterized protein YpbB
MELTYRKESDYLIPNLAFRTESQVTLGKYAYLRKKYLKRHRKVLYTKLLTSGNLTEHLWDIEQTALERMEAITKAMAESDLVTEELKANDPMKWAGLMNSIRSAAEEAILDELIYV